MMSDPTPEHVARMERLRAERAAQGRQPTIQTAAVYRLLAAVIAPDAQGPGPAAGSGSSLIVPAHGGGGVTHGS